jgi:hypothetical protein
VILFLQTNSPEIFIPLDTALPFRTRMMESKEDSTVLLCEHEARERPPVAYVQV